jgi:peptidoglycan/LPS O-acetylase OafA/YrhL
VYLSPIWRILDGMDSGERWRLGHRPGLDGLRGVAIGLVVIDHGFGRSRINGLGAAGVVMFFTLSGFLITSLLLEERAREGSISLPRFYLRRARRLLPALVVCVGVVGALGLVVPVVDYRLAVGALTYSANWIQASSGIEHMTALTHTWSLSIEEQFYLVWPLVLVALLRLASRRVATLATGVVVALTAVLPFVLFATTESFTRIYYGSDARSMPLLAGCLLALVMHGRPVRQVPAGLAVAALATAAMAALNGSIVTMTLADPQITAGLTCVAIWVVAQAERGPLEWAPMRLLGCRSYGLYLWHVPVFVTLVHFGASPLLVAAIGVPVAWGLTLLSWRFVEAPFLGGQVTRKKSKYASTVAPLLYEAHSPIAPGVKPGLKAV